MERINAVVRSAKKEDIPSLYHLLKESGLYFEPIDKDPKMYEKQLKHDPESIIVAEYDGQVIGIILFIFSPLFSHVGHLAVLLEHQRKDVGTLLLQEAWQRIKNRGGHYSGAYIEETNKPSLALFNSLGAEEYQPPLKGCFRSL